MLSTKVDMLLFEPAASFGSGRWWNMVDPCFVASECSCKLPALCRDLEPLTCFRSTLDRHAEAANLWHPFWGSWNGRAAETIGRRRRGDGTGQAGTSCSSWDCFAATPVDESVFKSMSHCKSLEAAEAPNPKPQSKPCEQPENPLRHL